MQEDWKSIGIMLQHSHMQVLNGGQPVQRIAGEYKGRVVINMCWSSAVPICHTKLLTMRAIHGAIFHKWLLYVPKNNNKGPALTLPGDPSKGLLGGVSTCCR